MNKDLMIYDCLSVSTDYPCMYVYMYTLYTFIDNIYYASVLYTYTMYLLLYYMYFE